MAKEWVEVVDKYPLVIILSVVSGIAVPTGIKEPLVHFHVALVKDFGNVAYDPELMVPFVKPVLAGMLHAEVKPVAACCPDGHDLRIVDEAPNGVSLPHDALADVNR